VWDNTFNCKPHGLSNGSSCVSPADASLPTLLQEMVMPSNTTSGLPATKIAYRDRGNSDTPQVMNFIASSQHAAFRRGSVGIRISHMPGGAGAYNALWLLGDGSNVFGASDVEGNLAPDFLWPCFGEIDMMEGFSSSPGSDGFNNPINQNGSKLTIHSTMCGDEFGGVGGDNACGAYYQQPTREFPCNPRCKQWDSLGVCTQYEETCEQFGGKGQPVR
jgi:hypothetical protein